MYLEHGPAFVNMLQLTQSSGGQITGVLSTISLSPDGKLASDSIPVTSGALDHDQLTLTLNSSIFGENISGKRQGDSIHFNGVGAKGALLSSDFQRSSPEDFKKYAGDLKAKALGIVTSVMLLDRTKQLRQLTQEAKQWVSNAEDHVARIHSGEVYLTGIEKKMQQLVAQEHLTANSVARSQISVSVDQEEVIGNQADLEINRVWDQEIGNSGMGIAQRLSTVPQECSSEEFKKLPISSDAVTNWESSCNELQTERTSFEQSSKYIMARRADVKSFQTSARSRRKMLVDEARQIR